ncbi:hypothetical protein F66182_8883 [Fusarium sp. NRRL 66182]|nr:hypothetical protein F66182_8883 [Fusarium sp. NRRL 66182]
MFNACRASPMRAAMSLSRVGRRFQSTQALREYFVVVWDRPGADRTQALDCDLSPPLYTYAGECLSDAGSGKPQSVIGNAFACLGSSVNDVKKMVDASVYAKKASQAPHAV